MLLVSRGGTIDSGRVRIELDLLVACVPEIGLFVLYSISCEFFLSLLRITC